MTKVACCIIAGQGGRAKLLDTQVIPSVLEQGFSEVVVVGTHHTGAGFRYLFVPDLTKTTLDALCKRDCATLATTADVLVYLADDHALCAGFGDGVRRMLEPGGPGWDVLVPSRWVEHPTQGRLRIPNGEENHYCAGHCGVFRRRVIQGRPWTAQRHDRLWDLYSSHDWLQSGVQFLSAPELQIQDLEPERCPWQ